jgi:alkanesulfonate monooxygenase SsuD/methylene tetrahydromethanopterin reductase-like flavin-dependent oxidoreductase (luciferase family)
MKYGIHAPNFGSFGNARDLARMARDAETGGWDGFFLWDQLLWLQPESPPTVDPWVALAAMATVTERIRLGTLVTPVARRRPQKLAREVVTLDQLTGGRMVLGVGLGEDDFKEYSGFGEPADYATHAQMLDEGLAVITGLWSGQPFSFSGKHYMVDGVQFLPPPVQRPRVPVWVGGAWPNKRPFRRAARWDGVAPQGLHGALTPQDVREIGNYIREHRSSDEAFDIAYIGNLPGAKDRAVEIVASYEEAGVTWWLESFSGYASTPVEDIRAILRKGPLQPSLGPEG